MIWEILFCVNNISMVYIIFEHIENRSLLM